MTDIEAKALALVNEVSDKHTDAESIYEVHVSVDLRAALCRAIEQHEAFKQQVSDAVEEYFGPKHLDVILAGHLLDRFIIPKPKPDPLREIAEAWGLHNTVAKSWVEDLRATLEARGFEIREKNDD